ncbi:protein phosphatase 1 regulatory subunit 7 [Meredithblackwellia eburnea MCA 4105]
MSSAADEATQVPPPDTLVPASDDEEGPPTPSSIEQEETHEAFANLKDERHFEEQKRRQAQLVMGPPIGGEENGNETVIPGQEIAENEAILRDFPDDAEDLELTHLRIKTLRGLGLERFKKVERISLRQNLLSSLSYTAKPPPTSEPKEMTGTESKADGEGGVSKDEVDEDEGDDVDAKKKEDEYEWDHHHDHAKGELVWPLRGLENLEELDLYDNRIKSVKGLEGLVGIKSLDLSFNLLRSIREFDDPSPESPYAFPQLDHLYLIQNKLSKIEGVQHRTTLDYLEMGGNRIRMIENLPISSNLRSLYLGKNKITRISNLEGLTGLRTLSIQSNRITKIEGLDTLIALEELYLSHNGITEIEGLSKNVNLTTLDIANNMIKEIPVEELKALDQLEELWANNNQITALPSLPPSTHPNLETIYLEGNPVQETLATAYRRKVLLEMPQVKQIDAVFVKQS